MLVCLISVAPLLTIGCKGKPLFRNSADSLAGSVQTLSAAAADTASFDSNRVKGYRKESEVECLGILVIPASETVIISPPAGGVLRTLYYPAGAYVIAGSTLAAVENMDFLKMQQEYLEAKSQFFYFGEELKRQGELTLESATSVKKMQQAQLDYQISEIKMRSLAKQLALCGIIADSVDVDHLSPLMYIRAPVTGYIHNISVQPGNPVLTGEILIAMVLNVHPVLQIEIPGRYFRTIKTGQPVEFFVPEDPSVVYKASLSFAGSQIDPVKHTFNARAIPADRSLRLPAGLQVRVKIILASRGT